MQTKAQPSTSPIIWFALLLTLGLVYWQWSATPEDAEDMLVTRSANTGDNKAATHLTAKSAPKSDGLVSAPVADKTLQNHPLQNKTAQDIPVEVNQAQASQAQANRVEADAIQAVIKRPLPTGKAAHVLFAAHEWLPPPVKPAPPPPPQAPPLPYSYVGSLKDMPAGDLIVLMRQSKIVMPKLGAKVDAQWRLDREDAQALYFTFMPLDKKVVLSKTKTATLTAARAVARPDEPDNMPTEEMLNQ